MVGFIETSEDVKIKETILGSWGQSVTVQQLLDGSKDCLSAADENVELASPFLCKNGEDISFIKIFQF